ncbi:MAG: response regulator [Verrucomicrobia bacterium]|nr:response regulator [Verrucomicrobiota bacterium]
MRNLKGLGIVLFAVAGVIPVVVLFLLIQAIGKSGGKQEAEKAQARLANSVKLQVENLMASSLHEAKSLKTNPVLLEPKLDPKKVGEELRRFGKGKFDDISILNAEGGVVASTNSSLQGDTTEGLKLALKNGQAIVSYPVMEGSAQKSSYSIYQPMKTADQRVIRLDFSFDRIRDILSKVQLDSGEELFLVDSTNRILFAKEPAQVLAAPFTRISTYPAWDSADDGESIETSDNGDVCFVQTVVIPELMDAKKKWLLVWVGGSRGEAALGMLPILFLVAAGVGVGLAILLSTLLTGKVRGAIIDVTEGLEAAASGDLKVELEPASMEETGAMVDAFNEMIENVRSGRDALETKVKEEGGALRESKERLNSATSELRAAFEAVREAVVMIDFDGKVIEANQHFCDLSSLPMEDLKAFAPDAMVEQLKGRFKNADGFGKQWQHFADNPRAVGNEEWLTPGSSPLTIDIRTVPVLSEDDEVMGRVWVFRDVTEVRSLDLQLRQSQKMGALGNLAAGVAHDFNNMLQGISGNVAFASLKLAEGEAESIPEHLGIASEACERSASLVRQLLNFSRKEDMEELVISCDIKKVVQETAMLLSRTLDPRLKLEVQVDEGVWPAKGDGNQLQQVIMNMCVNAGDAIYEEGVIRMEVANRVKVKVGGGKGSRSGEFVEVAIIDDGEGMVDEIRERIFEPFFSTKAQGEGTGLGLATCASIVEKLGGWIECESELALGTTFRIFLPRSRKAVGIGDSMDDVNLNFDSLGDGFRDGEGAGLKALVVDDEESVRDVAANILQEEGYEVVTAGNGEEAMKIIQEQDGKLAIVVLDLTMPVMSGRDAFVQMRNEYPDLPVIICSGYLMDIVDFVSELGHEPDDKVQKPYRLNVLRRKIKEVIARSQPADGGASDAAATTDSPS